jgi:hypothetical protein
MTVGNNPEAFIQNNNHGESLQAHIPLKNFPLIIHDGSKTNSNIYAKNLKRLKRQINRVLW